MFDIHSILSKYWGFHSFRPQQEEIISSVMAGRDTLALLPTGGGKSICYQVPALAREGICIVVSPLIALMKDQVENLRKRGIGTLLIHTGMNRRDIVRILENARQDYFKFLYVSPERLETSLFKEYLPALNINLIAVDEAHCISQWGYDFRPSYLRIAELRDEVPDVTVLAVTASATEDVQRDICDKLSLAQQRVVHGPQWNVFRQSFERKNLSYSVFRAESKMNKLVSIVKKVEGSGIIYCRSRKRTKEIAGLLQMHGVSAGHYHAGLQPEDRSGRQQDWIDNRIRVIVCTNAFGMGIDKPDVRFVVHADPPDCLESYYQEAGRCGRDGKKAYGVFLFDAQDLKELSELHLVRYPTFDQIKHVYVSLVNFLQIPNFTGQDERFIFRFDDFIRNFRLNSRQVMYSLQALEQDGWLEYNNRNFSPSTIVFSSSKNMLYEFYQSHPELETIAVTLLRNYDGIFDFPTFVSEAFLSKLMQIPIDELTVQLKRLASFGIISYVPQLDAPVLTFRKNRVAAEDLTINLRQYEKRKEVFVKRVQQMVAYIETAECRSRFISRYFGDMNVPPCGICDNCLDKKRLHLSSADFNRIEAAIRTLLQEESLTADQLIEQLKIKKEMAWYVLRFLQGEDKIQTDPSGKLTLQG